MSLTANLQCLLITFLLGMKEAKLNDIMQCGIGKVSDNEDSKMDCFNVKEFGENHPVPDICRLLECNPNHKLAWKITDKKLGRMEIRLHGMMEACNFDYYDIYLEVYDDVCDDEPVNEAHKCLAGSQLWKTHTKRTVSDLKCKNCTRDCVHVYTLVYKYVYPGIYRIKATPRVTDGSTRQSQVSYYFRIYESDSNYVKSRLIDLNCSISLQYRDSTRQLDIGIPLLMDIPPDVVGFEVKYSPKFVDLYAITRYGSDEEHDMNCIMGEKLSKPACHATKGLIDCTFYNMSEGDYKIVVEFIDDRCEMSTVWTESADDDEPCRWDVSKGVIDEYNLKPLPKETLVEASYYGILSSGIAVSVLIFVLVTYILMKKYRRQYDQRQFDRFDSDLSPRAVLYSVNSSSTSSNRFNFGQLLTLTERPRPEVLVLYARDSPAFTELMTRFRRVLDAVCKCQVYDCFDPDMWNEISRDPEGWIRALITERQAKVVIAASEIGLVRQRSLTSEETEMSYKSRHAFDHLLPYALKILRDGSTEDSYKNHFIVNFDGLTEAKDGLEFFNPYTRFTLPKHLSKLFEHLHESDLTVHFETSSQLEERYEVRQLRMQLEHLINLKLLARSNVDKEKLYDW